MILQAYASNMFMITKDLHLQPLIAVPELNNLTFQQ